MTAQQSTSCVAITRSLRLLFVLFTGTLVSSVFSFVVQLMLARLLMPGDLGRLVALLRLQRPIYFPRGDRARKSAYLGAGALVTAATSYALIPVLGIAGAAIANLLTEATLLVLHVVGTARYIDGISVTATTSVATLRHAFAHTLSEARDASA
jgi:O-antigen/teichoic acid export membrane protein